LGTILTFQTVSEGEFSEVGLRLKGILGSCASPCNPSYLSSLVNWAGLSRVPPFGMGAPMSQETANHSFDELARGLANGTLSRGKAIRLMGSALLGAALASVPGVAWANDRCSQGQTRCGDRCVNLQTNERHCGSCRNRCGPNQTCCKGRCVNLQKNENHCGSCSNRCDEGQECVEGMCSGGEPICNPPCPAGEKCTEGVPGSFPFCDPICNPICPEGCLCERDGDGNGNVCTGFVSGQVPSVDSCDQCPTKDFPGFTRCVNISLVPGSPYLLCKPPC
jgi:hypothetical protein